VPINIERELANEFYTFIINGVCVLARELLLPPA
jgi:hypothetical protein